MDKAEILSKAVLIISEGQHSPLEYVRADGTPIARDHTKDFEAVDFKCYLPNKYFDVLRTLFRTLTTSEEQEILWSFLKGTSLHESKHHEVFPFVFQFLLHSDKVTDAISSFFEHFHLCSIYKRALLDLLKNLQFEHPLFSYTDLLRIGQSLAALQDDPEIGRAFNNRPRLFKSAEQEEQNTVATLIFASQYLVHPLIRSLLLKRVERELTPEHAHISVDTHKIKQTLVRIEFSSPLYEALSKFEAEFATAADKFAFKSSIGHLRSFMEYLCREVAKKVESLKGIKFSDDITRPSDVRRYLTRNDVGFLSQREANLVGAVYGYISDRAVHALSTEPDEALICRNLTIEISLLIMKKIEKLISL